MSALDFASVLGGFGDQSRRIRQDEQARADHQWDLERRTLEWLATSDDPEIRAAAVTGIVTGVQQPAKGMRGWFGEMQQHPAFGNIARLLNTPVTSTQDVVTPESGKPIVGPGHELPIQGTPEDPTAGQGGNVIGQGGSRLSTLTGNPTLDNAATQKLGGGGGMGLVQGDNDINDQIIQDVINKSVPGRIINAVGQAGDVIARARGRVPISTVPITTTHPRQAFMSPEEKIGATSRATYSGRIQGLIGAAHDAGVDLSPADISDMVHGMAGSPRRSNQMERLSVQFKDGTTGVVNHDRMTGEYTNAAGDDVADLIARELPKSGGVGKIQTGTRQNDDGTFSKVEYRPNAQGGYDVVDMGPVAPPPAAIVTGDNGVFQVPRSPGQPAKPVAGVKPRAAGGGTGTTPDERAAVRNMQALAKDLADVEKEGKLGGITTQAGLDKAAKRRNYPSYQALRTAYENARKAANSRGGAASPVAPPPSPSSAQPPAAGGSSFGGKDGANRIRQFLP